MAPRGRPSAAVVADQAKANGYLTFEQIKARQAALPSEADLEIDALGGKVRVRRLSLREIRGIGERVEHETKGEGDAVLVMFYTAHLGLVEPKLTEAEFESVADEMPGVVFAINQKVNELTEGAGESGAAAVTAAAASFRRMG